MRAWAAWRNSYAPEVASAGSSPAGIVGVCAAMLSLFGLIGYLPAVAVHSQFQHPWVSMLLVVAGNVCTFLAHRHGCRGRVGETATLLDNVFYSSAVAYAAVSTAPSFGLGFGIVYGLMLVAMPAQVYALSLVFALALSLPLVALFLVSRPTMAVGVVLFGSLATTLVVSQFTGLRRVAQSEKNKLREALGAADRVADESMQAALATTLLSLGNFLHEMKNTQLVIHANLENLVERTDLSERTREVLVETVEAHRREEQLVRRVVESLEKRAKPLNTVLLLKEIVEHVASETKGVAVTVRTGSERFVVDGPPEYLRVVLVNLLRNAERAGARNVEIELRADPGGHEVKLLVKDDGPGVPAELRSQLFRAFTTGSSPGGTGLGLYLCRRYAELLGGQISLEESSRGGATFLLRLPFRHVNGGVEPTADTTRRTG